MYSEEELEALLKRGVPEEIVDLLELLSELVEDEDPRDQQLIEALINFSWSVEDGELNLAKYQDEMEEIKKLLRKAKARILKWEGLFDEFKSYRKEHPKSHWWWYPEEL